MNDTPIPFRPGLEKVPAAVSSICFLDGDEGILEYRGYRIEDLARSCSFEEVAHLLLFGELPGKEALRRFVERLEAGRAVPPRLVRVLETLPADGHPMHALEVAVAAVGMLSPRVPYHDQKSPDTRARREEAAVHLVALLPSLVAAWHRIRSGLAVVPPPAGASHSAAFLEMLTGEAQDADLVRVFDAAMVLHAEHEMNASTFTARVVASSLSDPYSVTAAAIASLRGPLHGGANERVLEMLGKIGSPEAVPGWIAETLAARGTIWGIGHREYRVKDPRAVILQGLNEAVFRKLGGTPLYAVATRVEEELARHPKFGAATEQRQRKFPNVDYYSGIVYQKMGIPADLFTPLFAMSRVAGWLAHYLEQTDPAKNRIFRPKQDYEGARARTVPPIAERS